MRSALSLLRVGVDLDGVLNDLGETCLRDLKSRGLAPQSFSWDDVREYNFEDCIPNLTKEQVWAMFQRGDVFWEAKPDKQAAAVLRDMREQGIKIHIVTSRNYSQYHRNLTESWLRVHGIPYDRLAIYGKQEKAAYAEAHRLDVFIEDHLPTAEWMADIVRCSIVLDMPYNRFEYKMDQNGAPQVEPPNLLRMFSWHEISKFFLGY